VLALSLVLTAGALAPGATPQAVFASTAPLPACTYGNVLTQHHRAADWQIALLDTYYRLGRRFVPPGLVSVDNAGIAGKGRVRDLVIPDLAALAEAAAANGTPVRVISAYRSYRYQKKVFRLEVRNHGRTHALSTVARPGHSEHQLGTAIDFGTANTSDYPWGIHDWAETPAGAWMKDNAWKYGFVMSYPAGDTSVTCYRYEPWHYRNVGREMAAAVHNSGLVLRQYLWENFE
jgi:D-alanyl-D-alanine carboxypeptidase